MPLDETEILMFSDSIKEAIQLYDGNFFLEHQDLSRTEDRVRDFGASGEVLERAKEVMAFFSLPDGILLGNPQEKTEWTYVEITRVLQREGKRLIQIRTHDPQFIFEYYEFLVEKRSFKGLEKIVISDYFSYNSGQWASQGIIDLGTLLYFSQTDSLAHAESTRAKDQVLSDYQRGSFSLAERGFHKLADSLQKDRFLYQVRLEAALEGADSLFPAIAAEYQSLFPDDMSIYGLLVEYHYDTKNYSAILSEIRNYEGILGGPDAYTQWIQGDLKVYLEELDSAAYFLDQALQLEPTFEPPLISRFYVYLDQKDYPGALDIFTRLEGLGYRLENMDLDEYPDFLNSSEMASWAANSDPMPSGKQ